MPTINKRELKTKPIKYKHEKQELAQDFYSSKAWRRLRDTYISLHPLCECCIQHEKIEPASEVHHKVPYLRGETEEERWSLFLDEKNLMSLCEKCHLGLHNKDKIYHLVKLDTLTDKEWKEAHKIDEF